MTRTICAVAGAARSQRPRRLAAGVLVRGVKLVHAACAGHQWHIDMREAEQKEERHHAGDGFELADLDVVETCPRARGDKKLFDTVFGDSTHDPDPVIAGAFLMCRLLAQDLRAIAAFHEFAEPRFRNHIRCFDVPAHGPVRAFFKDATPWPVSIKPWLRYCIIIRKM